MNEAGFWRSQALLKPRRDAPSMEELVDGAVSVLERVPASAHALADLLTSAAARDGRQHDAAIMGRLLARLRGARGAGASAPALFF